MDSIRGFGEDSATLAHSEESAIERPPEIGLDERRMHVRAYNYWVSLLEGRPYPSIGDVDPHTIEDFGENSVLLDFSRDPLNPEIAFLGRSLRCECDLDLSIRKINQVPARSLLSRLTDHYMQIIANRAPIGFEAEFVSQRGYNTLYRGILMPLSSNGEAIDFIYGVINWKELADHDTAGALNSEVDRVIAAAPAAGCATWADGPNAEFAPESEGGETALSLWPEDDQALVELARVADDAGLADRLCVARECAEQALLTESRSRGALYRALGEAYDFARAAESEPEAYAELLDDSGIKVQARAPMTPVVKLVFGIGYDKTRLTEFAACLGWAMREQVDAGTLAERIAASPGGLKGIVQAERRARAPERRPDRAKAARQFFETAPTLARVSVDNDAAEGEFVLLIARRQGDHLDILGTMADPAIVDQAIRKSA